MALHMVQMQPDMASAMRWAAGQDLLATRTDDLGYVWHALLAAVFHGLAPRPFALVERPRRAPMLLGYCDQDAAALQAQAAMFALPDAALAIGVATLAGKAMPEHFRDGLRLGFSVRVRPVIRTDGPDRNAVRERDAYLHAIDGRAPDTWPDRSAVYQDWLTRQLQQGGAAVQTVAIQALSSTDVARRGNDRRLRSFNGPDVTAGGVLRVTDGAAFAAMLARGVGRHRAFGFGMLLLRPC